MVEPNANANSLATQQQAAALYDAVVVPRFANLFGRLIVHELPEGQRGQVLSLGCGTGHPAYEMLRKMDVTARMIAVDRNEALIELARRRAVGDLSKRIFFKMEAHERLGFGNGVFDVVTGNLVLESSESETQLLGELRRVLVSGGQLILTRALSGSFEEVLDMIREIALRRDLQGVHRRLEIVAGRYPEADALAQTVRAHGFASVSVRHEDTQLSFRSAEDLMRDPMVRLVALPEWLWALRGDPKSEGNEGALLEEVERSLRTYFGQWPVTLTIRAGVVTARAEDE